MNGFKTLNRAITSNGEQEILDTIIEAMLDAAPRLRDADDSNWSEILVHSCRRMKKDRGLLGDERVAA